MVTAFGPTGSVFMVQFIFTPQARARNAGRRARQHELCHDGNAGMAYFGQINKA
ncbi:hypothetical protein [Micromonospora sp. NPDC050495]|uniref:hypothetical protein n=1 Tax=Micromonospora sp. NPDC050495 TaxID=3154936 RepID=UPI0033C6B794